MRLVGRVIFGIFAALLIAALVYFYTSHKREATAKTVEFPGYSEITAFKLEANKPLNFRLPKSAVTVKFIIHAVKDSSLQSPSVKKEPQLDAEQLSSLKEDNKNQIILPEFSRANYKVSYSFDPGGPVRTEEKVAVFGSFLNVENDTQSTLYKALKLSESISISRVLDIGLPGGSQNSVQLSAHMVDPSIRYFLIRPFYQERVGSNRNKVKWRRFSKSEKEYVMRFHPLGRLYADDDEINNVLSNRFSAVAPSGIEGESFEKTSLFVNEQRDNLIFVGENTHSGQNSILSPQFNRSLRVYQNIQLSLSLKPVDPEASSGKLVIIKKDTQGVISSQEINLDDELVKINLQPGSYILGASEAYYLQPLDLEETSKFNFAEQAHRFYEVTVEPIVFTLVPSLQEQQILMIKSDRPLNNGARKILYQIEGSEGNVVKQGELLMREDADPYLQMRRDTTLGSYTELNREYFALNGSERKLKIWTQGGSANVAVSNRFRSMSATVYRDSNVTKNNNAWFLLNADAHDQYQIQELVKTVLAYDRFAFDLEAPKPLSALSLNSKGFSTSKTFLEKSSSNDLIKASALSFFELPVNSLMDLKINNGNEEHLGRLNPSILYFSKSDKPQEIVVSINGKHYKFDVYARSGELSLPSLAPGQYEINIKSNANVAYYLNYCECRGDYFKKRQLSQVNRRAEFSYEKSHSGEQRLQLLVAADTEVNSLSFKVKVEADVAIVNDSMGFTNNVKRYHLERRSSEASLLDFAERQTDGLGKGQASLFAPIYIEIHDDIAIGSHAISVEFGDDSPKFFGVNLVSNADSKSVRAYSDRL